MFNTVSRAFKQIYANLGKADSAVFDDMLGGKLRKELLNESQFASVEANIKDDLIRNIGPIRRRNCIDAVVREAQSMLDGLAGIRGRLQERRQATQKRIDAISRFRTRFRDYILDTPRERDNPAVDEVMLVSNGHFNPVKYKRGLHDFYDFGFSGKKFSSVKLQQVIAGQKAVLVKQMKDDIRAITTDDFILSLHRNGERRNNICKYVHEAFREFALRMLKDDRIEFEPCFSAEEAEAMIRSVVDRLELPGLHDGFFVNVDAVAGKAMVSVRKLDCWQNLLWEFRKRNTNEAKQVFADLFNPSTETGPFAEMIEAVAAKIREGIAAWMNGTAFDALRDSFIHELDKEIEQLINEDREIQSAIKCDCSAVQKIVEKCEAVNDLIKKF
jgi:hypothetical protein